MGCDIHAFIEIFIDDNWHYFGQAIIERNYNIFARIAGVRDYGKIKPIAANRGLPDDISFMTNFQFKQDEGDAHSMSWITIDEMIQIHKEFPDNIWDLSKKEWSNITYGIWFFGNRIIYFRKHRQDYPSEIQDIRLVFWFDN